jgi:N-acyl-phosphatidylethanolamine-hydrolysing phospholipase D
MRLKEGFIQPTEQSIIDSITSEADLTIISSKIIKKPKVTWIGHATTLVQYQGINFLTDPHFYNVVGPMPKIGPKRLVDTPLNIEQLPPIDFVVISHNHYDHLDDKTVKALSNSTHWLVPLGLKKWLMKRNILEQNITELDWWESWNKGSEITVTLTPSQHWSKRTAFDTNKTLWGSWAIKIGEFNTWFAGDTGYNETLFKQIGERLGPFDLGLIPIGGYAPRYFMEVSHVDPKQAIQIHKDIRAKQSIGIHWGTIAITHEPFLEPKQLLTSERQKTGLDDNKFITINIGETHLVEIMESTISF